MSQQTVNTKGLNFARMNTETQALLDRLGLRYRAEQRMGELSIAGMQLIEIADGVTLDEIKSKTEASFTVAAGVKG